MSRDLLLVALSMMVWGLGEGAFLYFEPLYLQELGANPVEIGAILGTVGIAMAMAHLPAGYLADRLGRRPLMWAAWLLGTTATWVMALAGSLPGFVAGAILYGLTYFVAVPLNSYVTAARGRWSIGRALTLITAMFSLGGVAGPVIGGWIGSQYGLHRTFLFAAVLFVVSTAIILIIRPQPVEAALPNQGTNRLAQVIDARLVRYLLVVFVAMFCMYLPQPLSQNFLVNERNINLAQVGQLVAARGVGVVVISLSLGQINPRIGFLLAQLGVAAFCLLIWQGDTVPWYLAGYLLLGSYQTARSLATAQARSLVNTANMGLTYGLIETAGTLAIILAPPLAGWLYARSPAWIYAFSLGFIGFAWIVSLRLTPFSMKESI